MVVQHHAQRYSVGVYKIALPGEVRVEKLAVFCRVSGGWVKEGYDVNVVRPRLFTRADSGFYPFYEATVQPLIASSDPEDVEGLSIGQETVEQSGALWVVAKRSTTSMRVVLYGERFSGRCCSLTGTSRTGGITACEFQSGIATILYSLLVDARGPPGVAGWPMVGPVSAAGQLGCLRRV